jgi:hypothetical protein
MQILMRLKKGMKLRFIIRHVFSGHMSYVTLFQCSIGFLLVDICFVYMSCTKIFILTFHLTFKTNVGINLGFMHFVFFPITVKC